MGGVSRISVAMAKLAKPAGPKAARAVERARSGGDDLKKLIGNGPWHASSKKELALLDFANDLKVELMPRRFEALSLESASKRLGGDADKDIAKWRQQGKSVRLYQGKLTKDAKTVVIAMVTGKAGALTQFGDFHLYSKAGKALAKLRNVAVER